MAKSVQSLATELNGDQLPDLSDEALRQCGLSPQKIRFIRSLPVQQLSTLIPLVMAIGKEAARDVVDSGVLPFTAEIDINGHRRCAYERNGKRCTKYGTTDIPICNNHMEKAKMLSSHFGSPKLRETFDRFNNDPNKMSCTAELSLMRTMLATLLSKINDDNINIEIMAGVTAMCDKITVVVERLSKLEKVTPEHLNLVMKAMTDVAVQFISPEKLEDFAACVERISIEPNTLVQKSLYEPGQSITVNGKESVISIQKRALLETAERMGIAIDQ